MISNIDYADTSPHSVRYNVRFYICDVFNPECPFIGMTLLYQRVKDSKHGHGATRRTTEVMAQQDELYDYGNFWTMRFRPDGHNLRVPGN